MKLILTFYKATGKFYMCEDWLTDSKFLDQEDIDEISKKFKWDGYITIHSVEEDYEQPIRLIDLRI